MKLFKKERMNGCLRLVKVKVKHGCAMVTSAGVRAVACPGLWARYSKA